MTDYRLIPGYPGYSSGTDGSIWSHWLQIDGVWQISDRLIRRLREYPTDQGYLRVRLVVNGKRLTQRVHRLVLLTFIGPCPPGQETRHSNHDRSDNRLDNISWDTHEQNIQDREAVKDPLFYRGSDNPSSKLTEADVLELLARREAGAKVSELCKSYGSAANIYNILNGNLWGHVTGIPKRGRIIQPMENV